MSDSPEQLLPDAFGHTASDSATARSTEQDSQPILETPDSEFHVNLSMLNNLLPYGNAADNAIRTELSTSFETPNPRDAPPTQESLLRAASTAAGIEKDKRRQKLEDQRNIMIEELRQAEVASLEKEIQELSSKIIAENTRTPVVVDLVEPVLPTPPKSTDTTTTKVASRTPSPLLPLPQIPIEISIAQKMTIIDKTRTITVGGKITSDMALKFYQQARQADFSLHWTQCIMDQTLELIKLRVRTSYTLLRITEEEANNWNPTLLTTREMADIIYTLYSSAPRTETAVQIMRAINDFNFGFDLADRNIEEESYSNFLKLIKDHYGPIDTLSDELNHQIAKMIYRKLPAASEINKLYTDKTKLEIKGNTDTIVKALNRYLSVITTVRLITEKAAAHAIVGGRYFSGATTDKQNTLSSTNHVISYGANAQRAAAIPVLPQVRDTDFHERHRTTNNRCETCGKAHHTRAKCKLFGNRMCNNTSSMWHFSEIGKAWRKAGYHEFANNKYIPNWGTSEFTINFAPHGHIYPDEVYNGQEIVKEKINPNNPWKGYRKEDNHNNNNRSDHDQKRSRSESNQYVSALMNTVRPKLLPVRIYLNPQGRTTTEDGARAATAATVVTENEVDQREGTTATTVITTDPVPDKIPDPVTRTPALPIPETPEPDLPVNMAAKKNPSRDQRALIQTVAKARVVKTDALLDSGSLAGDFINTTTLAALGGTHNLRAAQDVIMVCSGLDNRCLESNVVLDITIEFDADNKVHKLNIPVRISNESPLGCIIGIETIKKYNIVQLVPHFFLSTEAIEALRTRLGLTENNKKRKAIEIETEEPHQVQPTDPSRTHICPIGCRECTAAGELTLPDIVRPVCDITTQVTNAPKHKVVRSVRFDDTPLESPIELITLPTTEVAPAQTPRPLAALIREIEQLQEVKDFGEEGIDHDKKDMFAPFRNNPQGDIDILNKITIRGTAEQQKRIRELCVKYKHIFKDELDSTPAKIEPFDLKVDKKKWETYKNRGPV